MTDPQVPQPPKPPQSDQIDPLLESLLAKARPIIAEERGLNLRSRVKIQTLGKQMKLPAKVVDQALQLLHGAPPIQGLGSEAPTETRYERAFGESIAKKIDSIPGRILTSKIEEKAISIGTRKYQLSETQARNIIRRVADEVGVPRVTLTEAERHTEQEIADVVGDQTWITGDKKDRLIRNAKRMGVSLDQTESMINRHLQFNFQQVQFERKLTDRLWILAAAIVVGTGVAIFAFFQIQQSRQENDRTVQPEQPATGVPDDPGETIEEARPPDWWNDELKLTLQKTRLRVRDFPAIHDSLRSKSARERSKGYQALFGLGQGKVNPQLIRDRVGKVIPELFLTEPEPLAARGMLKGFEEAIKMPAGSVPDSMDFFHRAFWALDLLNQSVGQESLTDEKVVAIQQMIEPITGSKFDLFLSDESRLRKQRQALADKYFKQLADVGNVAPSRSPELFEGLEELVGKELSKDKMQSLRLFFLTTFLRFEERQWQYVSKLLKETILNSSSNELGFFIDLMETSETQPLRILLAESLLERAGMNDEATSFKKLAVKLREYFGLNSIPTESVIESRRAEIDTLLSQFTGRWGVQPTDSNQLQSVQLLADSAYLTTLSVLLNSPDFETLQRLLDAGFPELGDPQYLLKIEGWLTDSESDADFLEDDKPITPADDVKADLNEVRGLLQTYLAQLNHYQVLKPTRRIAILRGIQQCSILIDRIDAKGAGYLAKYLLVRKPSGEQTDVLKITNYFQRWPRLLIATADLLEQPREPGEPQPFSRDVSVAIASRLVDEELGGLNTNWAEQLALKLNLTAAKRIRANLATMAGPSNEPSGTALKSLLEAFYRLRVKALGSPKTIPQQIDLATSVEFLIEYQASELEPSRDAKTLSQLEKRKLVGETFGGDPLSRLHLHQQFLLATLGPKGKTEKPGIGKPLIVRLRNLLVNHISKRSDIAGQIAENEIEMFLYYYQREVK